MFCLFIQLQEQLLQSAFEEKKEFLGLSINSYIVDFAYAGFDRNFVLELKKLFGKFNKYLNNWFY